MQAILKTIAFMAISASAFAATGKITTTSSTETTTPTEGTHYLYVVNAGAGTFDGETLTLNQVPSVIYFTESPDRVAGHMTTEGFIRTVGETVSEGPTSATLAITTPEGTQTIPVELTNITINGDKVTTTIDTFGTDLPKNFSSSSLFIDPYTIIDNQ